MHFYGFLFHFLPQVWNNLFHTCFLLFHTCFFFSTGFESQDQVLKSSNPVTFEPRAWIDCRFFVSPSDRKKYTSAPRYISFLRRVQRKKKRQSKIQARGSNVTFFTEGEKNWMSIPDIELQSQCRKKNRCEITENSGDIDYFTPAGWNKIKNRKNALKIIEHFTYGNENYYFVTQNR